MSHISVTLPDLSLPRRHPMKPLRLLAAAVLGLALGASALADSKYLVPVIPPQGPAKIRFAPDFPALYDHQYGFRIGGFGGIAKGLKPSHVPVIFVHGNEDDHADWYPVRDNFRAAGWSDQSLWALSYNGLGGNSLMVTTTNPERDAEHKEMGYDGLSHVTSNDVNVPDLYDFILAVRAYTGQNQFVLVTHSLGVTLARKTLKVHPELRRDLVAFVGIAGANHGTSLCPPGSEGVVNSCDEIAMSTPWLAALNGLAGLDETYPPARWLTVYDGTGLGDPAYATAVYAKSPQLRNAANAEFPLTYHNDLRLEPAIIDIYRNFIRQSELLAGY